MLTYPNIDPIALDLGFIKIHWYGITYLLAFTGSWLLLQYRSKKYPNTLNSKQIEDVIFYGALGVILGGRIGYTLFYNLDAFLQQPLILFQIWNGGMSFHGGLLGVLISMWLFGKKEKMSFFQITDQIALVVPFGLACGRIGNFINAELWGRPSDLPWAMIFPTDPLALPRHPSMLYEFLLEGVILFCILWFFARKQRPLRAISALFLIAYGLFRFLVEFVRQPDQHMGKDGFIAADWLTQGMILSVPMIIAGVIILYFAYQHDNMAKNNMAKIEAN